MCRSLPISAIIFCLILFLGACAHRTPKAESQTAEKIIIATAANMQFAMQALTEKYSATTGIACDLVVSSSGKLTAQILEGAPFDLFIAANMKYPDEVFEKGFANTPPTIYAYGKLVLWTLQEEFSPAIDLLKTEQIQHIAIANPVNAPYGAAAIEALENYNLLDEVKSKLVYGESIAQTNQFINTKAAEVGFTAMSIVVAPKIKGIGRWIEVDSSSYTPIAQGVLLLNHSANQNALALQFYDFLFSEDAQEILHQFGYSSPKQTQAKKK